MAIRLSIRDLALWIAIVAIWLAAALRDTDEFSPFEQVVRAGIVTVAMVVFTAVMRVSLMGRQVSWATCALIIGGTVFVVRLIVAFSLHH